MPLTRTSLLRLIRILAAVVIAGTIVAYAIWRSLNYARGPHIDIFEPVNGSSVASATTTVRGISERINNLTLNGNPIFIDEEGHFSEVIIVFPGINRLTIAGRDQFGRETSTLLEIVGKGVLPEARAQKAEPVGTTTATSTGTTTQI
jgi:hypothetical protein